MARKALIVKANKPPKYSTRKHSRCLYCGRSGGNIRLYRFYKDDKEVVICRIHFREYAYQGGLPGIRKASW